ncbi:hypothetical protein MAP00_003560 [Monascus purpureus]|nr:hypothetical protein MAP00_003560 [Monascus purpureus]
MPSIPLHPHPSTLNANTNTAIDNPLPPLLQTPSGLAILELQGTINIPSSVQEPVKSDMSRLPFSQGVTFETHVGKLMFPDYSPHHDKDDKKWMKRVYLYVGRYQRMTGEVKELSNPVAVIQKRPRRDIGKGNGKGEGEMDVDSEQVAAPSSEGVEGDELELEIVEIIRYKLLFKSRPEPVNDS